MDFMKPEVVKLIVERLRVSPKVPEKVEMKFKTRRGLARPSRSLVILCACSGDVSTAVRPRGHKR